MEQSNTVAIEISAVADGSDFPFIHLDTALISIATVFDCSIDYLLGRSDDFGNINIKAPDLSDEEQELLDLFRNSSPGEQNAVLTLLRRKKSDNQIKFG